MSYVVINDQRYDIPEVNFDTICQLEENGVYLLNMDRRSPKVATMIRGLVAWIIGISPEAASREIQEHIEKGGNIMDIMTQVTKALQESGFFKQSGASSEKVQKIPQDHRRRKNQRSHTQHSQRS